MNYIVWHDFGREGWQPSDMILTSIDEVWSYLQTNPNRHVPFKITREVEVRLIDSHTVPDYQLPHLTYPPGVRGVDAFGETVARYTGIDTSEGGTR